MSQINDKWKSLKDQQTKSFHKYQMKCLKRVSESNWSHCHLCTMHQRNDKRHIISPFNAIVDSNEKSKAEKKSTNGSSHSQACHVAPSSHARSQFAKLTTLPRFLFCLILVLSEPGSEKFEFEFLKKLGKSREVTLKVGIFKFKFTDILGWQEQNNL